MAGGKETPRQKMIGMMYLVLTALLALQVSNTVLERFIFINDSLENTVTEANEGNANTVTRIQQQVDKAGNKKADVAVLNKAQEVRAETKKVLEEVDKLKKAIIEETGGEEDGEYKGLKNEEVLANMMINKKGGEELKNLLNNYAAYLREKSGLEIEPIAYDGNEHPVLKDNPQHSKKDFATLNFAQTPMVAGLATLTQFETEILRRESTVLDKLARDVGAEEVKFDKIVPMVRPESKVVAAGNKYVADMFIAASSSAVNPDMYVNGNKVPVENGFGKVVLPATGGDYDKDGLAKKSFKAEIKVTLPGGRDTTYTNIIEYFVAKPVIQVQSASVQALYLQCGNELNVQVPALGTNYSPSFSADGAAVYPGSRTGVVTLVPNAAKVKLNVSSGGNYIGSEEFNVRRVPKPQIVALVNGKEADQKTGMKISQLRGTLRMAAVADEDFKSFLPKDARFRVQEYNIYLAAGSRPKASQRVTGPDFNLNSFVSQARPGDRIVVEVTKVQRMNFKDAVLDVNVGTPTFTITITE